jgi:hypothetical protein
MRRATFLVALVLLAACSSLGDLGGILGSPSVNQPSDVSGVVTAVDTNAQRIDLNVNYVNQLRPNSSQSTGSIYWDSQTRVTYQGQAYRPTDLERGDEISVKGYNNSGRYVASDITVTRNARG